MKRNLFIVTLVLLGTLAWAQTAPIGSPQWFGQARGLPENKAVLKSLTGAENFSRLTPHYVEFAGQIVLVSGAPAGNIPGLRISSRNTKSDPLERAPRLDADGGFYTVLKRGQTYDLYWASPGGKEKFASVTVPSKGFPFFKRVFQVRQLP